MKLRSMMLVGALTTALSPAAMAFDLGGIIQAGSQALTAAKFSDEDAKSLANQACAQSDKQAQSPSAKDKYSKRLNNIAKKLGNEINGQPVNYKVYINKDVNAWAMANGCVRVYTGLMDIMDDDEIVGILGHEMGHVALGHTKKSLQTAYAVAAARTVATSAGGNTVATLADSELGSFAEALINAQFSQSQELDSDNFSFDLLTKKNLKRESLATAFEKLASINGNNHSMLSSHPASLDRSNNIKNRIATGK